MKPKRTHRCLIFHILMVPFDENFIKRHVMKTKNILSSVRIGLRIWYSYESASSKFQNNVCSHQKLTSLVCPNACNDRKLLHIEKILRLMTRINLIKNNLRNRLGNTTLNELMLIFTRDKTKKIDLHKLAKYVARSVWKYKKNEPFSEDYSRSII